MRSLRSILIYGRDIHLLETRCWVLERAGFHVVSSSNLHDAVDQLSDAVDLVILCHTLSPEECTRILANLHLWHPKTKTLALNTTHSGCVSKDDFVLRDFSSPLALIHAVSQMMNIPFGFA